jgi:hypothetical protein
VAQLSIPSGHALTAAEWDQILSYLQPLYVRKAADEGINNSAVLQNDDELFVTVKANADYQVFGHLIFSAGTIEDFQYAWTAPAGATFDWQMGGETAGATVANGQQWWQANTLAGSDAAAGINGATNCVARPSGLLRIASTAGTFRLKWAQNVAGSGTTTTVRAGSFLVLHRVA